MPTSDFKTVPAMSRISFNKRLSNVNCVQGAISTSSLQEKPDAWERFKRSTRMTRNTKDITRQYLTHGHSSITTCVLCNSRESGLGAILLIEKWGPMPGLGRQAQLGDKKRQLHRVCSSSCQGQRTSEVWEEIPPAALERSACRGGIQGWPVCPQLQMPASRAGNH